MFAVALPARADDTAAHPATAKRSTSYTSSAVPALPGAAGPAAGRVDSVSSGFLYFPTTPQGVNVGGRVPVGKSRLYVPYYGNVSNDPAHPSVQGAAGLAYGFRTWDISVLNSGVSAPQTLPGFEAPKTNPALSVSIRF